MKTLKKLAGFTLSAMIVLSCFSGLSSISVSAAEDESTANPAVGAATDALNISAGEQGNVEESSKFYVAGSSEDIFGTMWDSYNEDNLMQAKEDGTYEIVYYNVEPEMCVMLRVVEQPANGGNSIWHGDETDNNISFDIREPCNLIVNYNPKTMEITVLGDFGDHVVVLNPKPYVYVREIYAVGNGDSEVDENYLHGISWEPGAEENKMTEIEYGIYEITFEGVSKNTGYEVKFAKDGSWSNNWGGIFVGSGIETDADYNGSNIIFDVDEDNSTVVLRLDLTNFDYSTKTGAKFTITINDEVESTDPVEDANLKFKNYSLSLASNIEMNFNVAQDTLEGYEEPYVVVTLNGEETIITDYTVSGTNYVFKFSKIYPQLIGENVSAVLHAKKGIADHYSAPYTKSVKGYCENIFHFDHSKYGTLHTLLVNLLNYGEAAQKYLNFKTNQLCTRDLTEAQKGWAITPADCDELQSVKNFHHDVIADPTVQFKAASLSLGSTVGIKMYFTTADIDNTTIVATINGNEYNFSSEDFEPVSGYSDRYCLTFNNLLANDMRKTVYFRGYQNGKLASDTATYSIESYVAAHTNDTGAYANLAKLINAMYLYGEAAKAFAG